MSLSYHLLDNFFAAPAQFLAKFGHQFPQPIFCSRPKFPPSGNIELVRGMGGEKKSDMRRLSLACCPYSTPVIRIYWPAACAAVKRVGKHEKEWSAP